MLYHCNSEIRIAKPDSPHHQAILSSLFNQPPRMSRSALYDIEADPPDHSSLNDTVQERLSTLFHLHGAVDMEPPLLMPVMDPEEDRNHATFIDRHGDIVSLPSDILVPFARLAARSNIKRIKRYHISNVYRPKSVPRCSSCISMTDTFIAWLGIQKPKKRQFLISLLRISNLVHWLQAPRLFRLPTTS